MSGANVFFSNTTKMSKMGIITGANQFLGPQAIIPSKSSATVCSKVRHPSWPAHFFNNLSCSVKSVVRLGSDCPGMSSMNLCSGYSRLMMARMSFQLQPCAHACRRAFFTSGSRTAAT